MDNNNTKFLNEEHEALKAKLMKMFHDADKKFEGKKCNQKQILRALMIRHLANQLKNMKDISFEVLNVDGSDPDPSKPNAMTYIDVKKYTYIKSARQKKIFTDMIALADDIFFTASDDGQKIRISFGTLKIWEE